MDLNLKENKAPVEKGDITTRDNAMEARSKKPEDVIGFLRAHNFGFRDELAVVSVEKFIRYMQEFKPDPNEIYNLVVEKYSFEENHNQTKIYNYHPPATKEDFTLLDSFIAVLVEAGYAKEGEISRDVWSQEAELALSNAFKDFNDYSISEQKELSAKHENWRS